MCNQTCFSVDTFTFLYDDDDDDDDDNDDEHYPILTHKIPYIWDYVRMGFWASAILIISMIMLHHPLGWGKFHKVTAPMIL